RFAAETRAKADIQSLFPPREGERLKSPPRLRARPGQGLRPFFLFWSPAYKPLDNPKVRRAMTHAIDRDRIIKLVLEGNAYPLRGLLGPQVFGYDPEARAYPYDPEKAKQLLVEAGFVNGFEIDYYSPTGRYP